MVSAVSAVTTFGPCLELTAHMCRWRGGKYSSKHLDFMHSLGEGGRQGLEDGGVACEGIVEKGLTMNF